MAGMLPETATAAKKGEMPSKTWRLDLENQRVLGTMDGEEALKQAILLRLSVPRYEHVIYSFDYGNELSSLIGKSGDYAQAAAPALLEECLLRDDRVSEVRDVKFERSGENLHCTFVVGLAGGGVSSFSL